MTNNNKITTTGIRAKDPNKWYLSLGNGCSCLLIKILLAKFDFDKFNLSNGFSLWKEKMTAFLALQQFNNIGRWIQITCRIGAMLEGWDSCHIIGSDRRSPKRYGCIWLVITNVFISGFIGYPDLVLMVLLVSELAIQIMVMVETW